MWSINLFLGTNACFTSRSCCYGVFSTVDCQFRIHCLEGLPGDRLHFILKSLAFYYTVVSCPSFPFTNLELSWVLHTSFIVLFLTLSSLVFPAIVLRVFISAVRRVYLVSFVLFLQMLSLKQSDTLHNVAHSLLKAFSLQSSWRLALRIKPPFRLYSVERFLEP